MAKFYSPPESLGNPPPIDWQDSERTSAAQEKWVEKVKAWCKEYGKGELVGEEWRYPVADGYARYIILDEKPLTLLHLDLGDGWNLDKPTARGLRLSDVRASIEFHKHTLAMIEKQRRKREA